MRVVITDESHNQATWQARHPLLQILVSLLLVVLLLTALVVFSPSTVRWQVGGTIVGLGLAVAVALVLTTPLVDGGSLERTPDGGALRRTKTWLGRGAREALILDLVDVEAFDVETADFEDGPVETYPLGRLWVVDRAGNRAALTDWAEVPSVQALGDALARAGRRTLSTGESQEEGAAVV